ncbi:MAG: hypothetical protein JNN15_04890 [Blastocatellia bacterium]|nr:hypothetical protein [Blastocatellia bacterium]
MSSEYVPNRKVLKAYKRVLVDFQLVWAIKRHYETMTYSLTDEELMTSPIDLNRVYGTLKVLYEILQKNDSPAIVSRLELTAKDIVATFEWFAELDKRISPYEFRVYLEHAPDIDYAQLKAFAKYFLNKDNPSPEDIAKADYLVTRSFSWVDPEATVRINQDSEESLESEIEKLLPKRVRKKRSERSNMAENEAVDFINRLEAISSYDDLVNSGLIDAARRFKTNLGEDFHNAAVLSKCVQLNVLMRNQFEKFSREENDRLKKFALALINSGTDKIHVGIGEQELSASSVLEFSEQAQSIFASDYTQTKPYLEQVTKLRDLMHRTLMIYGLDPYGGVPNSIPNMAELAESYGEKLIEYRIEALNRQISSLQIRARASTVKVLPLENSTLVLSSWEFDAFKTAPADNYFAKLCSDVLKNVVALIAEIQENLALYKENENKPQLANPYLMRVNFLVIQAQRLSEQLQRLSDTARDRNDIDTACNLSATRQKLLDSYDRLKPLLDKSGK